jgi:GDP-4-dehydro-6-deoxy-D-mannose reductase
MSTTRPVLVTGAAGFAGSHLLDLLQDEGVPLVAWRRPGEPLPPPPTGAGCRWMEVDVVDRAQVDSAILEAAPAAVYHLAGSAQVARSWDDSAGTLAVNVMGTCNVLSAVSRLPHSCPTLVTGSALVYRQQDRAITEDDPLGPSNPYGLSKLAQELAALHAAAEGRSPVFLARSFNHVGPRQSPSFFSSNFARQIARIEAGLAPPELATGNLEPRRDLTDVRDIVRAYRSLLHAGKPGRAYNVCSGRAVQVGEVLDTLLSLATVSISVRCDPLLLRRNDTPLLLGSPSMLQGATGWLPRIPLSQTLADLLGYWRARVSSEPDDRA